MANVARLLLRLLATLGWLAIISVVAAEELAEPRPYTLTAGNYVFVMLAKGSTPAPLSSTGQPYRSSGLYRDNGSIHPLWSVDWYAAEVYVSPDGMHLVEMGPRPIMKGQTRDLSVRALAFYEEGQLLKEYDIGDLIQQPDILPRSDSHYQWKRQVIFDGVDNRLAIGTLDGQLFTFDVATGLILQQRLD